MLPQRVRFLGSSVLVPGMAVHVDLAVKEQSVSLLVYLPNDGLVEAAGAIMSFCDFTLPRIVAGNINCDLAAPRTDRERSCVGTLINLLEAIGSVPIPLGGVTRIDCLIFQTLTSLLCRSPNCGGGALGSA